MAAPLAPVLGAAGKAYRNSGVIGVGAATWDLVPNVKDIDFPITFEDHDASSRSGVGWKQHEPTLGDIAGTLVMMYNPADVDLVAMRDAAYNRKAVEFLFMDQATGNGFGHGIRAIYKIFKSNRKEGLAAIMEMEFDLKLCWWDPQIPAGAGNIPGFLGAPSVVTL